VDEWRTAHVEPLQLAAEVTANLVSLAGGCGGGGDDEQEWGSDDEDGMEEEALHAADASAAGGSGSGAGGEGAPTLEVRRAVPRCCLRELVPQMPPDDCTAVAAHMLWALAAHLSGGHQ
jgi:hypothetical protein